MKISLKCAGLLIVALFIFFLPALSHARIASPPPELTSIFNDFAELETAFKSGNWDGALSATGKIDMTFNRMLPQLKKDLKTNPEKTYNEISNNIKKSLNEKSSVATQRNFIELHRFIFTLSSNYEYKTRPIFIVIGKYIAEAEEANNIKNYHRVVSELDEIITIFGFVENYLDNKAAKRQKVEGIKTILNEIRVAGINKKSDTIKTGLKSLKKMLTSLIQN
ncbi:hypothetical protein OR1_00945 [Geobacter sp. OR-1]|uniref:hypothetical protein n=1 Tax=Geobacter sp. OR-1 TaxID=1266765 RepID=UPI000543542D|nr:hypothetical protein [Geobacter sp. OR-1]GAM08673.1 hypothetical protein OR1_00945 [Geobacter sp. OR-1]